jgi:hypothetical protein
VELFEQIRREYEFGIGTIAGVAKKVGVHRRMVREAIGSAVPKPRKKAERPRWKLRMAVEFIDAILEGDRKAPRKQRHTAHRIWERIGQQLPECRIGERTVRQYVHNRKIVLGMAGHRSAYRRGGATIRFGTFQLQLGNTWCPEKIGAQQVNLPPGDRCRLWAEPDEELTDEELKKMCRFRRFSRVGCNGDQ